MLSTGGKMHFKIANYCLKYYFTSSKPKERIMKNRVRINLELRLGSKETRSAFFKPQLQPEGDITTKISKILGDICISSVLKNKLSRR